MPSMCLHITWDLLNDLIDLLHENLLQEDQVVEQVCGKVVLKWSNLHTRRNELKMASFLINSALENVVATSATQRR